MAVAKLKDRSSTGSPAIEAREPAVVTVFTTDDALLRSLATLLSEHRFRLIARRRTESLAGFLTDRRTDAVLLDLRLPVSTRIDIGRQIRGMARKPSIPIVGVCDAGTSYDARLAALQDGFWDVVELPSAAAELEAKLGTWVWLKRDVDGLHSGALLDSESGHYTSQGMKRRLRELTALAQRTGAALSCVVFGPDREPDSMKVSAEALLDVGRKFSLALHHRTRNSDVVGRLESLKFIVLAPDTPSAGAIKLAERFTSLSLSRRVDGDFPLTFSAGVAGVDGRNGQVHACPELLLVAANRALNEARSNGTAQVAAAWGRTD